MPTARIPVLVKENLRLRKNLRIMGLTRLLDLPWDVTNHSLFQNLLLSHPALPSPVCAHISKWTEKLIGNVCQVPSRGSGMCDGNDELRGYVKTFFEPT